MRQRSKQTIYKLNEGYKVPQNAVLSNLHSRITKFYQDKIGFSKEEVLDAIDSRDITTLRLISRRASSLSSGIYSRLLWYMALLPTYDCIINPYLKIDDSMINYSAEIRTIMNQALRFVDKLNVHELSSYLAYDVLVDGISFKIKIPTDDSIVLQELPINYCRTRYKINNKDVIEFNAKYFDTIYDSVERQIILQTLPSIFSKEYNRYKNNKILLDRQDRGAWFALPVEMGEVFYLTKDFYPFFIKVIPDILDWEAMKDLNLAKSEQELSKILVQQFGMNKNGDPSLQENEVEALHNNALDMIGDIEGLDVLSTFADVNILDLQQKSGFSNSNDPIRNFLNSIYTTAGISSNLFATDGNLALDKSITNDESIMFMLFVKKIQNFINFELQQRFDTSTIGLICDFPRITIYNFKDMADLFKSQATYGYSKRLPAIATGQSQSSLIAGIEYENDIMQLSERMKPLQSSATQSNKNTDSNEETQMGRTPLPDSEKSDKTIQNLESNS